MTIRTIVVDDEPLARSLLISMLSENQGIEIIGEYGDGLGALEAIRSEAPDLVFLDIQMPGMTGLDLIRSLEPDEMPEIVFVTAYDQFALKAFELNAVDYLLKPFDEERLEEAVARVRTRHAAQRTQRTDRILDLLQDMAPQLARGTLKRIAVRRGERTVLHPVETIEWLEAEGKYVRLHLVGGKPELIRETMTALEDRLDAETFYRVSRSAIVNLDHVREIHPWFHGDLALIMKSGTQVQTTRSYRDRIKQVLENR